MSKTEYRPIGEVKTPREHLTQLRSGIYVPPGIEPSHAEDRSNLGDRGYVIAMRRLCAGYKVEEFALDLIEAGLTLEEAAKRLEFIDNQLREKSAQRRSGRRAR